MATEHNREVLAALLQDAPPRPLGKTQDGITANVRNTRAVRAHAPSHVDPPKCPGGPHVALGLPQLGAPIRNSLLDESAHFITSLCFRCRRVLSAYANGTASSEEGASS